MKCAIINSSKHSIYFYACMVSDSSCFLLTGTSIPLLSSFLYHNIVYFSSLRKSAPLMDQQAPSLLERHFLLSGCPVEPHRGILLSIQRPHHWLGSCWMFSELVKFGINQHLYECDGNSAVRLKNSNVLDLEYCLLLSWLFIKYFFDASHLQQPWF